MSEREKKIFHHAENSNQPFRSHWSELCEEISDAVPRLATAVRSHT